MTCHFLLNIALILHKSLDREKKSPKIYLIFFLYFHDICLDVFFKTSLSFHLVNFSQSRFV